MGWLNEFKTFAFKGNVIDLAVGIILGVAFGKVVSSLVSDVIMPPIGLVDRRRRLQPAGRHAQGRFGQQRGACRPAGEDQLRDVHQHRHRVSHRRIRRVRAREGRQRRQAPRGGRPRPVRRGKGPRRDPRHPQKSGLRSGQRPAGGNRVGRWRHGVTAPLALPRPAPCRRLRSLAGSLAFSTTARIIQSPSVNGSRLAPGRPV